MGRPMLALQQTGRLRVTRAKNQNLNGGEVCSRGSTPHLEELWNVSCPPCLLALMCISPVGLFGSDP
jgi:hypothetical protein